MTGVPLRYLRFLIVHLPVAEALSDERVATPRPQGLKNVMSRRTLPKPVAGYAHKRRVLEVGLPCISSPCRLVVQAYPHASPDRRLGTPRRRIGARRVPAHRSIRAEDVADANFNGNVQIVNTTT